MTAIRFPNSGGSGGSSFSNSGRETQPPPNNTTTYPLDADGDEFDANAIAVAWNRRGAGFAAGDVTYPSYDGAVALNLHQGEGLYRPCPAGDFEIVASIVGIQNSSNDVDHFENMIGVGIVDNSGNGVGFSAYNGTVAFSWTLTAYAYNTTGNSVSIAGGDGGFRSYLALRKTGTDYTGRISVVDAAGTWTAFTTAVTGPASPTQMGVGRFLNGGPADQTIWVSRFNVYPGPTFFVP